MAKHHLFQEVGGTSANFLVEIDGVEIGQFAECQGLQVELEIETYAEGGMNGFEHKLPGRVTWPNIVLKRGVTFDDRLFGWFNASGGATFAAKGKVDRKTVGVTMIAPNGERLRTWKLQDALPVRWTGPTFATSSDDQLTEELEVAHHGFAAETLKQ